MSEIENKVIETKILIDTVPYIIEKKSVGHIIVKPISFVKFVSLIDDATPGDEFAKSFLRLRIRAQASAYDAAGNPLAMGDLDLAQMPIVYARKVTPLLNVGAGAAGNLVGEGDGITSPVLFRLGTPIGTNKAELISELEFSAKVFADVEDILAEDTSHKQALAMIRRIALPVGTNIKLLALPSWAVEGITLSDGLHIMDKVLPRFLG